MKEKKEKKNERERKSDKERGIDPVGFCMKIFLWPSIIQKTTQRQKSRYFFVSTFFSMFGLKQ